MSDVLASGVLDVEGRPASWVRSGALDGRPLILLAHGAGAPLTSAFMDGVSRGLVGRGLVVARFHFPYMEEMARGGRRRPPDREAVLLATWRAMIGEAGSWQGTGVLVAGGKSLGGRMASMLLASDGALGVRGAVYLGYPLHPAGRKDRLRSGHLSEVAVPQLFVSGTKDALCDLELLASVIARMAGRARLHVVEGGDHSLAISRTEPMLGSGHWLQAVADFVKSLERSR